MTFIPHQQEKYCFIACSEDKVNAGLCDCVNRMRNEALRQPPVSCLICPSCGNSDKYVKYYNEDMICQGCGYDLGQICS